MKCFEIYILFNQTFEGTRNTKPFTVRNRFFNFLLDCQLNQLNGVKDRLGLVS